MENFGIWKLPNNYDNQEKLYFYHDIVSIDTDNLFEELYHYSIMYIRTVTIVYYENNYRIYA